MGEVFLEESFDSLAYNIARQVRERKTPTIPLRVLEIDTWSGQSTLAIAQPNVLVYCCSLWDMSPPYGSPKRSERQWLEVRQGEGNCPEHIAFRTFVQNANGIVFRTAMPLRLPLEVLRGCWTDPLDAVYINGEDNPAWLRYCVQLWEPLVRPGGNFYGLYKDHTVEALTGLGGYQVDGTIWRHRVLKEWEHEDPTPAREPD